MQPRQRSKCSATVWFSSTRSVERRLHQPDPAARRVHLLVPELVGRAGRQAEAAVDAVVDQARVHQASIPSGSKEARTRSASGDQACALGAVDVGDPGPGRASRQSCQSNGRPAAGGRPAAAALSSQTASSAGSPGQAADLRRDGRLGALEQAARAGPAAGSRRRSARAASGWSSAQSARGSSVSATTVACGGGPRMEPQRDARDQPEPAARAGEELPEVVAGDVLHHLAARARDHPVRQDDRDADHEVAHRAVAVAARAGEIAGEAGADRRVARRVEREHLAVLGRGSAWSSESRIPASTIAVRSPGSCSSTRVERRRREHDLAAVAVDRDASRPEASTAGPPRASPAQRRSARPARSSGCAR